MRHLSAPAAKTSLLVLAATAALVLSACEGRTADNMTPTGETVTVDIQPVSADTISQVSSADSTPEI